MFDVMLDLETLGSKPSSAVLSAAAVAFDPDKVETSDNDFLQPINLLLSPNPPQMVDRNFYYVLALEDQENRTFDAGAIYFWLQQEEAARKAQWTRPINVLAVLHAYVEFIDKIKPRYVWCNGATFDHVIWDNLLKSYNIPNPVRYFNQIDMRTIRKLAISLNFPDMSRPANLTPHNALDDCWRQIMWLQSTLYAIKTMKLNSDALMNVT